MVGHVGLEPTTCRFGAWDEIWTHADSASISLSSRSPTELLKHEPDALTTWANGPYKPYKLKNNSVNELNNLPLLYA